MRREEFARLLQRYLDNTCTVSEKRLVEYWYGLLEANPPAGQETVDFDEMEARLWQKINPSVNSGFPLPAAETSRTDSRSRRLYYRVGIAASLLMLCVAGWLFFASRHQPAGQTKGVANGAPVSWRERVNTTDAATLFTLMDGSLVTLSPGSRLRYPPAFTDSTREVYLDGEAFFQVEKAPSRPFYVYAGDVVTRVLGTSFRVLMEAGKKQVAVEVVTGRVSVYEKKSAKRADSPNGVILSPNHKATYFADKQHFVIGLAETPVPVDLDKKDASPSFVYDDVPARNVLADLEKAYSIDIVVENEQLNECPLTANISEKPLRTQLNIICAALQSSYSVQGTTILISGKGCP